VRRDLPTGLVTFLFTDVEGSTSLLRELGGEAYAGELEEHRRVIREACGREGGVEVDTQGDAFFFAFPTAPGALAAAAAFSEALSAGPIRVRVGVHAGTPRVTSEGYVGVDVHRAARIAACGHGGQVVVSSATAALVDPSGSEPPALSLSPLGAHRLKDFDEPVSLYQLGEGTFPPLETIANTNLPTPASSFLGREAELYEADELLRKTRVLTVAGPGGQGKTRFALELAHQARQKRFSDYPDGVFACFLAPLRDPGLVMTTLALTLSVAEQPGRSVQEALVDHLEGKRLLVLLDNVEHLLECAHELAALVASCPGVTLLVTSRELLNVQGELVYDLPPLEKEEGVTLFCERAHVAPSDTIRELCSRLEGLPLAIELAAARLRLLSPEQLLARLSRRLDLLTGGRDADPRQRTLRATIAWSYDLLDGEEQRTYRALSVFAGGCTLDAAQAVTHADVDTLQSLLDKSLLRRRDEGPEPRYWMLETIREHASELLAGAADESDAVVERFLDWMQDVVGDIDHVWIERDQIDWLTTLELERANFMSAVATAERLGRRDRVLRLVVAADAFIDARGPYEVFAEVLDGARCGDATMDGRALLLRLRLLLRLGRHDEAAARSETAAAEVTGDLSLEGRLLTLRSFLANYRGDFDEAFALSREAVRRQRLTTDDAGLAEALSSYGVAVILEGDVDGGLTHLRESRLLSERVGDTTGASSGRMNEAIGLLSARRPEEASGLIEEGMALTRALDNPFLLVLALGNLSIARAAAGDTAGARSALREALAYEMKQHDQATQAEVPLTLAIAAVHDREPERAIMLWAAGSESCRDTGYELGPELTVYVADLLEPLRGRPGFEALWERGRSLSASEALELGLGGRR
jgi:predicted ATPase/class 3 adenylate cyclase